MARQIWFPSSKSSRLSSTSDFYGFSKRTTGFNGSTRHEKKNRSPFTLLLCQKKQDSHNLIKASLFHPHHYCWISEIQLTTWDAKKHLLNNRMNYLHLNWWSQGFWTISSTAEEILHQLRLVVYPIIYKVLAPSQVVVWDFWTINSITTKKSTNQSPHSLIRTLWKVTHLI